MLTLYCKHAEEIQSISELANKGKNIVKLYVDQCFPSSIMYLQTYIQIEKQELNRVWFPKYQCIPLDE